MGKLVLTPDDLATTPEAGLIEFDGVAPTMSFGTNNRSVIPGVQYRVIGSGLVGLNSTGDQSILGAGVNLTEDTMYAFEGNFNFFKTAGTTSHTFRFGWGGTASLGRIVTNMMVQTSAQGFVTVNDARMIRQYTLENAGPFGLVTSSTAFSTVNIQVRGVVTVLGSGTLTPQYSLSAAPGGAYTSAASNNMCIWPIGVDVDDDITVGDWA